MIGVIADFRIACRNLLRNRRRTIVAILTVAGGITAYLQAGGFIAWNLLQMREATIHSQLGHLQIVRPGYFEKGIADPYSYLLPPAPSWQKKAGEIPGTLTLTPRLAFSGLVSRGDATVAFLGEGVDPQGERPVSSRIGILTGNDLARTDEKAVLLGEGLAASLDVKAGDTVVLLVTAANGSPNAVEVKVAGIFGTSSKDFDDHALRLPIAVARKLMRVDGATSWVFLLDSTEKTDQGAQSLKSILPTTEFEVVPWTELADFYNKTVVLFSKQVNVVKFIIGLIIVLTISNTQMMSVMERTTEIGTSLAIGLKRSAILRLFIIEGGLIGILGGALGVALGYSLAVGISAVGIPMPPAPGMAHGYLSEILVTPSLAANALTLAFITTLLASIAPSWKASRLCIVDALRSNQ